MDSKAEPILPDAIPAPSGAVFLSPDEVGRLFGELASSRETSARQDAELTAAGIEIQSLVRSREALQAAALKIQALTLELAHHRRMRFGQNSESLAAAGQRELFEETLAADLAASEAELEEARHALNPKAPRQPRASPAPAPGGSRCRRTCRASNTATSPRPAPAGNAAANWSRSAKTSANNWRSNPPSSPPNRKRSL